MSRVRVAGSLVRVLSRCQVYINNKYIIIYISNIICAYTIQTILRSRQLNIILYYNGCATIEKSPQWSVVDVVILCMYRGFVLRLNASRTRPFFYNNNARSVLRLIAKKWIAPNRDVYAIIVMKINNNIADIPLAHDLNSLNVRKISISRSIISLIAIIVYYYYANTEHDSSTANLQQTSCIRVIAYNIAQ